MKKSIRFCIGMKKNKIISIIVVLCFCVNTMRAASIPEQLQRVTVIQKDKTVRQVLDYIEDNSHFIFLYPEKCFDENRKISLDIEEKPISDVLDVIFGKTGIVYVIDNNQIILKRKKTVEIPLLDQEEKVLLKGVVTDKTGIPLIGANVYLKNTTIGVITDADGRFQLELPVGNNVLEVSYVGYKSQQINIKGKNVISVILEEDTQVLDDWVVVGYGTQHRSMVTNAISTLKIDEGNIKLSSLSPAQLLQGRIAGVNMSLGTGNLGARERISIRGISSLSASNEPLYVVDGIPIVNSNGNLYDYGDRMSSLTSLNLNDVESIEILKDAASSAIYGSRATNGVVLITTRSGKSGKSEFKFNINTGIANFANKNRVKLADSNLYIEQYNEGIDNYNKQYGYKVGDDNYVPHIFNPHPTVPDVDWLGLILQTGKSLNVDGSFSGGTAKTRFYVSGVYNDREGIVRTNSMKKMALNAKIIHEMYSWLEIGANNMGSYVNNKQVPGSNSGASILARAVQKRPFDLPYKPNGDYYVGGTDELVFHNPVQILNEGKNSIDNYRYLGSYYATFKYKDLLSFKTSFNADVMYTDDYTYYNERHPYGLGEGRLIESSRLVKNWTFDNVLNFNHKIGSLYLSAMAGHSFQKIESKTMGTDVNGFPSPSFDVTSVASTIANASGNISEFAMESYFARVSLSFKERYLFNATVRSDGSSKFARSERWGMFPSVSLGWNISKEPFMESSNIDLKLRVSYGKTGNQEDIGNYAYLPQLSGGYNYGYESGLAFNNFGNDQLTWEKADQYNLGFDLTFFQSKVNVLFDIYQKNTNNLLYNKPIHATSGMGSIMSNIGSMRNRGVEFSLNTYFSLGPVLWNSQFNIASNQNKLTSLLGDDLLAIGANRALQVGKSIGSFYLFKMDGIYQYDGEVPNAQYEQGIRAGDVKWHDRDGNGIINDDDRFVMGTSNPKFTGGWSNMFKYKNIQLDIFFTFMYGNQVYAAWKPSALARIGYLAGCLEEDVENRWTGPGSTNEYPRSINGAVCINNVRNSDRFLEDGSFIRLSSLSLSYTFPQHILSKVKIKSLRAYCQGENLWLHSKYSGWDPDVSTDMSPTKYGVDNFSMPAPRTVSFGLNIGF